MFGSSHLETSFFSLHFLKGLCGLGPFLEGFFGLEGRIVLFGKIQCHEGLGLYELLHIQNGWVHVISPGTQSVPPQHLYIHNVCIVLQREVFSIFDLVRLHHRMFLLLY